MGEPARSSRSGLLRSRVRCQAGQGEVFGQVCTEGVTCKSFGTIPVVELSIHQVALHQMNVLVAGHTFVAESTVLKGALCWDILLLPGSEDGGRSAVVRWREVLFGRA